MQKKVEINAKIEQNSKILGKDRVSVRPHSIIFGLNTSKFHVLILPLFTVRPWRIYLPSPNVFSRLYNVATTFIGSFKKLNKMSHPSV